MGRTFGGRLVPRDQKRKPLSDVTDIDFVLAQDCIHSKEIFIAMRISFC